MVHAQTQPSILSQYEEAGTVVSENGNDTCVIVVAKDDSGPVQLAAAELQRFLKEMSGADIKIVHGAQEAPKAKGKLYVGPKAALAAKPDLDLKSLGSESYILHTTTDEDTILVGGEPRGTLYAVYGALQEMGCRWWTPTVSTIPKSEIVALAPYRGKIQVQSPAFSYRDVYYLGAFNPEWALHNRTNGGRTGLKPDQGGCLKPAILVHSFIKLIPPETYFEKHPEWFSQVNGKRLKEKSQLCLTNEAMLEELIKNTREELKKKPDCAHISISQNDWDNHCTCDACKAIDDAEGSTAGTIVGFVNKVATRLKPEFPGVTFTTLAYEYSVAPPKITRPADNVTVFVCTIRAGFEKPINQQTTRPIGGQIKEWSKLGNVFVWDYLPNFNHVVLPYPNLYVIGPNFKFYKEMGVQGVLAQGIYNTPASEMAELRTWVAAQLLWDPNQDSAKLIEEFVQGYYRQSAPAVMKYIALNQAAMEKFDGKLTLYSRHVEKYLTLDLWLSSWNALQEAQTLAGDDLEMQSRIAVLQLPLRYEYVMRFNDFHAKAKEQSVSLPGALAKTLGGAAEEFKALAAKSGLTRVYENKPGFERIDEHVANGGNPPPKPAK
jgi:hypothetical protein